MFKLSRLTDYATVLLAEMYRNGMRKTGDSAVFSTGALARRTGIPEPMTARTMKALLRAGLVDSVRGAQGGYRLSERQNEITIADILHATEGPVVLVSCLQTAADGHCAMEENCRLFGHWGPVNRAVEKALESVTLKDMAQSASLFRIQRKDPYRLPQTAKEYA